MIFGAIWCRPIIARKSHMDPERANGKITNEDKTETNRIQEFRLPFDVVSVAVVETIFNKKNGTPRQSGICPQSKGVIRIHKKLFNNPGHTIEGIEQFQYLWILFYFHQNKNRRRFIAKVHPPRLNGASCGVFASRTPHRPNAFGLTIVRLDRVDSIDGSLHVSGLDLIDQTPIVDIKPYIEKYDYPERHLNLLTLGNEGQSNDSEEKESSLPSSKNTTVDPGWVDGSIVNEIQVDFTTRSLGQLSRFHSRNHHGSDACCEYCFRLFENIDEAKDAIINLLRPDPRSVYRRKKCTDRLYFFTIDSIHITAWFDIETDLVEVIKIKPYNSN